MITLSGVYCTEMYRNVENIIFSYFFFEIKDHRHWCTIGVPSFLEDFEIIPIPMLEARFMGGWERGSGGGAPCKVRGFADQLG
jgi:hypothetical protein